MTDFDITPITFDQCLHCPRTAVKIVSHIAPSDEQLRHMKTFQEHCVIAVNWSWCLTMRLITRVIQPYEG